MACPRFIVFRATSRWNYRVTIVSGSQIILWICRSRDGLAGNRRFLVFSIVMLYWGGRHGDLRKDMHYICLHGIFCFDRCNLDVICHRLKIRPPQLAASFICRYWPHAWSLLNFSGGPFSCWVGNVCGLSWWVVDP